MICRAWLSRGSSKSEVGRVCGARLLAMLNENAPQLLDHAEKRLTHLLDQDAPQQDAEQADVAAERKILGGIGGAGSQLVEPAALVVSIPK